MEGEITSKKPDEISNISDVGGGWQAAGAQAQSQTHLEDDKGTGDLVVIRCFEFSANPEAFKQHTPSKQELFNYHSKQIELMLWKDGMKVIPEVDPRVIINKKKTKYRIFVGATAAKGHLLPSNIKPKTLSQLAQNQ